MDSNNKFLSQKEKFRIEKIVRALQARMWKKAGQPRNYMDSFSPQKIAKLLGYQFAYFESLDDPLRPNDTNIAGIIDPSNHTICLSLKFKKEIRLYTAAHEIGHAVLHPGISAHRDKPKDGIYSHKDYKERQADYFAACLLMPRQALIKTFKYYFGSYPLPVNSKTAHLLNPANPSSVLNTNKGSIEKYIASLTKFNSKSFDSLSKTFNVSPYAMAYRLEELGVVSYTPLQVKTVRLSQPIKEIINLPNKSDPLVKIGSLMSEPQKIKKRGESPTWRGYIECADGSHSSVYVKDIKEEQVAKELFLAVIARKIGLPITQACLVSVKPKILPENTSQKFIFGLVDAKSLPILNRTTLSTKIVDWEFFLLCAVFDSWIGNGDRLPNNLLFDQVNSTFYLIDHGEALGESYTGQNNLIQAYKEYTGLHSSLLLSHLLEESKSLKKVDLEKIKMEIVSSNGAVCAKHIDPLITQLKERLQELPKLLNAQTR